MVLVEGRVIKIVK